MFNKLEPARTFAHWVTRITTNSVRSTASLVLGLQATLGLLLHSHSMSFTFNTTSFKYLNCPGTRHGNASMR